MVECDRAFPLVSSVAVLFRFTVPASQGFELKTMIKPSGTLANV